MIPAGSFLGGAKNRLLPVSVPLRFFLSAAGFHVLAWAALFSGAEDLPGFTGGTGWVLAATHLLTLGVLALSAIGASYQLLPVVTRQPLLSDRPARLSYWLLLPGILILAFGMLGTSTLAMQSGAGLVTVGLLIFALLTAENLRRAGDLPIVAAHGWGALAALVGLTTLAALLIADFEFGFLADHQALAVAHMVFAVFGFMGLLVFGLSLVLIPMFALSTSLPPRPGWVQLGLSLTAGAVFLAGLWGETPLLYLLSAGFMSAGALTYLWLMRHAWNGRMRKRLGLPFVLIRISWVLLVLGLVLGLMLAGGFDRWLPNSGALFGFVLLVGWLLTFLTGVLQRIMPFLASMHASGKSGMPPLLSELTAEMPLKIHAACHLAAFVICLVGIVSESGLLVRIGTGFGFAGALAFAAFALSVVHKLRALTDA